MNKIRIFFRIINIIGDFLFKEHIKGFNGFTILFMSIVLIGGILNSVFNGIFSKLSALLFILLFCLAIPYGFINEKGLKKYIFVGERKSFKEIFRIFSFRSYCISLLFITIFLCIPIIGVLFGLTILGAIDSQELISNNIFYTMIFIESILWFAYHIVNGRVDIQDIKIKVTLFSAVAATILIFVDVILMLKDFKLILSYIAGSYFWVNFLIELRIKELKNTKKCECEV